MYINFYWCASLIHTRKGGVGLAEVHSPLRFGSRSQSFMLPGLIQLSGLINHGVLRRADVVSYFSCLREAAFPAVRSVDFSLGITGSCRQRLECASSFAVVSGVSHSRGVVFHGTALRTW